MKLIGLTGSIGMGKSTAAAMLRRLKLPLYDADRAVHRVMRPHGPAVAAIAAAFPGVVRDGAVSRKALGDAVFADPSALRRLEAIVHPLVAAERQRLIRAWRRRRVPIAVLDMPLMYEINAASQVDLAIVVSAPARLQRRRVLARPGMTAPRFESILARQVPDREKRRRADFVVPTGLGRATTLRSLRRIIRLLRAGWTRRRRHAGNRARYRNDRA